MHGVVDISRETLFAAVITIRSPSFVQPSLGVARVEVGFDSPCPSFICLTTRQPAFTRLHRFASRDRASCYRPQPLRSFTVGWGRGSVFKLRHAHTSNAQHRGPIFRLPRRAVRSCCVDVCSTFAMFFSVSATIRSVFAYRFLYPVFARWPVCLQHLTRDYAVILWYLRPRPRL